MYGDGSTSSTQTATITLSAVRQAVRQNLHGTHQWYQFKVSGSGGNLPVTLTEQNYFLLGKRRR
jgi:hypothetical protein